MGGASSIGGEDVRPSRDVQSLLIPESHEFIRGSMSSLIAIMLLVFLMLTTRQ